MNRLRSLCITCLTVLIFSSALGQENTEQKTSDETDAQKEKAPTARQGERILVDTLDEKVPLEVGVQLRIFKQARGRKLEIERLEGQLERRRLRTQQMLEEVERRYQAMRVVQEELSNQLKQSKEQDPAQAKMSKAKAAKERREQVARLSKVFNKMKADEAAKMIPVMDEELVIEVVSKLKPKQAASILGKLEAELAAKLTTKMAEAKRSN